MLTLCFHLQYFSLFVGTRVQLLECIFVFSKRLIEFDLFDSESDRYRYTYHCFICTYREAVI